MRFVIQRVKSASLRVDDKVVSEIGAGLLVLCGVCTGDDEKKVETACRKISQMRIFERDDKMNLSVIDTNGEIMLVSNFTLCTREQSGNRPYFGLSADRETADRLYLQLADELNKAGVHTVTGMFGADMQIDVHMDGPVTIYQEI